MRGSIIQQSPNSYTLILNDKDENGKRKQRWITVKCNKRQAEKRLAELIMQIENGTYTNPGKITLKEHLNDWLNGYVRSNLAGRTYELYELIIRKHINPGIGKYSLVLLKSHQIQKLYADKLEEGLSNRTVQIIHFVLHKALTYAIHTGMISHNPLDAVEIPKSQRQELHIMGEADIHLFLDMARKTEYHALFYLLLFTGIRRGEALALRWSDVDMLMMQMSISRSLQYINKGKVTERATFKQPKTDQGRRTVSLSPTTILVLQEHRERQEATRRYAGLPVSDEDLIFAHTDGTPLLPNSVTHAWIKLRKKAGLTGVRLHDARHSHASLLLKQNVHPKIVQERLGHASIRTTLDIYSHVVPGMQQAAAQKFDDILFKSVSKPLVNEKND